MAAATVPTETDQLLDAPGRDPTGPAAVSPLLRELCARAGDLGRYERWCRQVRAAGYCQQPVRLAGTVEHADTATGELGSVLDTRGEPDGVLLKACGTRKAAQCAPCAEVYRADAYQLIRAGLAGGKGVRETIAEHPRLLVTFTAPSFGPVHSSRVRRGRVRVCRPARPQARCPHGRPKRCGLRHLPGDSALGMPLCGDCYDHQRAVVWNALAPELWRRTTVYLSRALARLAGLTAARAGEQVRVAYAKVAEYQARGAVHYHAVIRLDAADPDSSPPGWATAELLAAAIRKAAGDVGVPCPLGGPPLRWGDQLDLHPISDHAGGDELSAGRVAGYVAKYATKATEHLAAGLDRPIRIRRQLEELDAPEHVRRLAAACWLLGGQAELTGLRLRRRAYLLGFGGHTITKSRRYSTSFQALRAARRAWTARRLHGAAVPLDQDGRLLPPAGMVAVTSWQYAGRGYRTTADAWLAWSMAQDAREGRRIAWEEVRTRAA